MVLVINSIFSLPAIPDITSMQFNVSDWMWILFFILVMIIVWALLARAASNAEDEANELSDGVEQEPDHH